MLHTTAKKGCLVSYILEIMEKIIELRKKYLLKFYFRPKYVFKKIAGCISNPVVFKNYVKHGLKLLKITK